MLFFMTFVSKNEENEAYIEKKPLVLIDSSVEVDMNMLADADAEKKEIKCAYDITEVEREDYTSRTIVVSSEHTEMKYIADKLGYKIVIVK